MPITTTANITNLQEKVIGPARLTLKDDVLAIKDSLLVVTGEAGMNDTYNSPKLPGVTAFGLTQGVDMASETLVDSNVAITATEVGVSVDLTRKMLRTLKADAFLRDAGKAMASAINVKQEQDFATLISGLANSVGANGTTTTIGSLGAALAQLRANVEPVTESMFKDVSAIVHPYGWHDLSQQLFPTGSGDSFAPWVAQNNDANTRTLKGYWPVGVYFGTPIKVSTNVVLTGTDSSSGVVFKNMSLIYDFMPVDLEIDESDKSMRNVELDMVIDYGYGKLNDGFGRLWLHDATAPTS